MADDDPMSALEQEVRHLRRLESLGLLTASVVHDFNNLLTPILCLTTLLSREVERGSHAAALASEIQSAAERAKLLARQVLTFARKRPSRIERVDVRALISDLRVLIERVVGDDIDVVLALADELGDTMLDKEQLEHVVLNLAVNARDAMPQGGTLTLEVANVTLGDAESGHAPAELVALVVGDDGVGITPEVRARMFERFFTTKEDGEGTGLGLAAAKRFADEHKGLLSVRSEPGLGTKVALYLPRAARRELPTIPAGPRREAPGGGETVLVVDDDDHVRGAVRAVLEERGYRVLEASSSTVENTAAHPELLSVDLVLVDPGARRSPTRPWLERLRRSSAPPRILLMSGHTDEAVSEMVASGEPLLRKAFTHEDLALGVRAALDQAS